MQITISAKGGKRKSSQRKAVEESKEFNTYGEFIKVQKAVEAWGKKNAKTFGIKLDNYDFYKHGSIALAYAIELDDASEKGAVIVSLQKVVKRLKAKVVHTGDGLAKRVTVNPERRLMHVSIVPTSYRSPELTL